VTSKAKATSLSHSACMPEMTLISLNPKIGSSPARINGANQAIGNRMSKDRLAIRRMFNIGGLFAECLAMIAVTQLRQNLVADGVGSLRQIINTLMRSYQG
jgi:hypothetical protein